MALHPLCSIHRGSIPGEQDKSTWGLRAKLHQTLSREPKVVFRLSLMCEQCSVPCPVSAIIRVIKDVLFCPTQRDASADCDRNCTLAEMAQAVYCLVPDGGVEGWSLRLFDSIMQVCAFPQYELWAKF